MQIILIDSEDFLFYEALFYYDWLLSAMVHT